MERTLSADVPGVNRRVVCYFFPRKKVLRTKRIFVYSVTLYCPYTAVLYTAHIQLFTCTVHARIELYFILPIYSCTLYCPYTAFHLHCTCPYIAVLYIAHIQLYFILPYITINYIAHKHRCEPGSLVGIATAYGLDGPGIESRWCEIFRTSPDRP